MQIWPVSGKYDRPLLRETPGSFGGRRTLVKQVVYDYPKTKSKAFREKLG